MVSDRKGGAPPVVYVLGALAVSLGVWQLKETVFPAFSKSLPFIGNPTEELVILGDTFSGYSTFRSPEFNQELEQFGLSLQFENEFDQAERAARWQKGNADLMVTTLDQYLKHSPDGKIVG